MVIHTITTPVIYESQLQDALQQLTSFASKFEDLFDPDTDWRPNQHFSLHLFNDIRMFGPLHVFQLFACERYNGILQGVHTDGRAPQKTMMREVRQYQKIINLPFSGIYSFTRWSQD